MINPFQNKGLSQTTVLINSWLHLRDQLIKSMISFCFRRQWVFTESWDPTTWCQYQQPTRTNNAIEGYHHRLKVISKDKPGFYGLIITLTMELQLTQHHKAAIDAGNFTQRKPSKENKDFQERLVELWSNFENGIITERQLLAKLAYLDQPLVAKSCHFNA